VLTPISAETRLVMDRLTDVEQLRRARVHPVAVLAALVTYQQGHGMRGTQTWTPVPQIVDALDQAFYKAFQHVEPTRKRLVLALDVSGSMGMGQVAGVPGLTPRVASAAMALVTAVTERRVTIVGFSHELIPLTITPRQRLDDVVKAISNIPFGATDCAQPMLWALQNGVQADAFIIYTDNETWFGQIHPAQALQQYRERTGIAAKLVVVGMTANKVSIADPADAGMLDVVGFDTAVPQLISDFIQQ
jgi:60 kDa SS-A/Ro ribonucleoprotein